MDAGPSAQRTSGKPWEGSHHIHHTWGRRELHQPASCPQATLEEPQSQSGQGQLWYSEERSLRCGLAHQNLPLLLHSSHGGGGNSCHGAESDAAVAVAAGAQRGRESADHHWCCWHHRSCCCCCCCCCHRGEDGEGDRHSERSEGCSSPWLIVVRKLWV